MATLDRYLQTKGRLSPPQAAKVTLEVVRKMIGTGDHGVVHPGRISIGQDRSVSLVTEDRTLPVAIELPVYASPELIQGNEHSEASALYSLGCTFFELLAGSPPFSASDPKETLKAHLETSPPALGDLVPGVPAVLARTVAALLSKSPAERGSLKDLESRLVRALGPAKKQAAQKQEAPSAANVASAEEAEIRPPEQRPKATAGKPGARGRKAGGPGRQSSEGGEPGRRRAGAKAPGKRGRGASSLSGSSRAIAAKRMRRSGRRNASPGYDDEFDEGERGHAVRRKKTYPLSMLGALLGLVIGALLVFQGAQRARQQPEAIAQRKEQDVETRREDRKKRYAAEYRQRGEDVKALLRRSNGIKTAELRYEWLVKGMDDQHFSSPQGPLLAAAVYKALEERDRERSEVEEGTPEDSGFTRIKTVAQKLYDQDRLGDALIKMADAYQDFKSQHGEEIDAFVMKVSEELTDRWGKDRAAIEKHLERSEPALAVKLLKKAKDYGDAAIRSEVEASLGQVQELLLIQSPDGDEDTEDGEEEEEEDDEEGDDDEEEDDWDDDDDEDADEEEEEEEDEDWDDDDDDEDAEEEDEDWDDDDDDDDEDAEEEDEDWDDDDDDEGDDDWDDDDDEEEEEDEEEDEDDDWDDDDDDDDEEEEDDDWDDDDDEDAEEEDEEEDEDDDWDDDDDDEEDEDDDWEE